MFAHDAEPRAAPFREAIQMIGADDHPQRKVLAADYRCWIRKFVGNAAHAPHLPVNWYILYELMASGGLS